jgi:signal transduction histidine kinase
MEENGTNDSSGGSRSVTRKWPRWTARLAVYALLVAAALLLLLRFQLSVGRQMAALEQEFGEVEAENYYVGVQARTMLRQLDERLLNCLLDQKPTDREAFFKEADELHAWVRKREGSLHTAKERQLFVKLEAAYDRYLADAKLLLDPADGLAAPAPFAKSHQMVQQKSQPLLRLLEDFVGAQQAAFNDFLQASQDTLSSLRQLLNLSVVLLVVSTIALAVVVYRGMIAPLRRVLSQSQAVIERQEKLASLGTLAAGVAHEIRNPLTALKFRLFSLRKALPPEFADHEDTAVISAEVNRLEKIVKDFLQFARPSDPEPVRLPAQRLLEEVHDLLADQLAKTGVALQLESSGPIWIHADGQQIKQVVINLVQNAAESIGRNGTITLRVQAGTEALAGHRGPVAILAVADTGPGIPPEVEKRLFDPFFTTKEGGTGLGLAIAARIVTKHGGLLRYQTRLNHGTVFEIVLPGIDDHGTTNPHH